MLRKTLFSLFIFSFYQYQPLALANPIDTLKKPFWMTLSSTPVNDTHLVKDGEQVNIPSYDKTKIIVDRLKSWFQVDLGKISQNENFAYFRSYHTDDSLKNSSFGHTFILPFPKKGWGSYLKVMLTPDFYLSLGLSDPNDCKTLVGHKTPIDQKEYFKMLETGYKSKDLGQICLTAWHQDALEEKKCPSGFGFASCVEVSSFGNLTPFLRCSYVKGSHFDMARSLSIGLGYAKPFSRSKDHVGIIGTWAHPCREAWRDQTTFETYYKCYLPLGICATPHIQFNYHPYKNKVHNTEFVFGMHVKSSF